MKTPIARIALSLSAVGSIVIPAAFTVPGCLSSSTTSDGGTGGSSSSSGSGSGSGSGSSSSGSGSSGGDDGGAGGPVVCLPPEAGPVDPSCVIDDMSGISTLTGGYYYTYSDRTIPNTTTVVPGAAGSITPAEGAQFPADMTGVGGPSIPGVSGLANFREFKGAGLTLWGAGMGFDWTDQLPDSGTADVDDAAAILGVPIAYDASAHKGISFYAKSNTGANQAASVHFSDSREAAAAGMCNADAAYIVYDGGADTINSKTECGDDFLKSLTFTPNWQAFTVKFSSASTTDYSGMMLKSLDTTKLYQVHFQVNNPGYAGKGPIMAQTPFDISVAYITWYDGN